MIKQDDNDYSDFKFPELKEVGAFERTLSIEAAANGEYAKAATIQLNSSFNRAVELLHSEGLCVEIIDKAKPVDVRTLADKIITDIENGEVENSVRVEISLQILELIWQIQVSVDRPDILGKISGTIEDSKGLLMMLSYQLGHLNHFAWCLESGFLADYSVAKYLEAKNLYDKKRGGGHNRKWIDRAMPYREKYPHLSRTALAEKILADYPDGNKARVMDSIKPLFSAD